MGLIGHQKGGRGRRREQMVEKEENFERVKAYSTWAVTEFFSLCWLLDRRQSLLSKVGWLILPVTCQLTQ